MTANTRQENVERMLSCGDIREGCYEYECWRSKTSRATARNPNKLEQAPKKRGRFRFLIS